MKIQKDLTLERVLENLKHRKQLAPLTPLEIKAKKYQANIEYQARKKKYEDMMSLNDDEYNESLHLRRLANDAVKYGAQLEQYSEEERPEILRAIFEKDGFKYDPQTKEIILAKGMTFKLDGGKLALEPSQFFANMGWLPSYQRLARIIKGFPFQDFFEENEIERGNGLIYYNDYGIADMLEAYKVPNDYVNILYNPDGSIQFEEQYHTYLDLHKGIKIPSSALNDFTSKPEIFLALVSDIAFQVARPIARELAVFKMKMLQNPLDLSSDVDWDTLTPNATFTYDSGENLVSQINSWVNDAETISRNFQPEPWRPIGSKVGLEIGLETEKYFAIYDNKVDNFLNMYVKAGLHNQDNLNLGVKSKVVSFKNTFEGFIGAKTHQDKFMETGTFYMILASPMSAFVMKMYEGMRAQPLLVFFNVAHQYVRFGDMWDKNYPIFLFKCVSKTGKLPIPPLVAGGTLNVATSGSGSGVDKAYVDAGDAKSLADANTNTTNQINANNDKTFTPNTDGSVKYNGTKDLDMNKHNLANTGA